MLNSLANTLCIDMNRVYIHGMSNGGMLTHYLAQQLPDVFAAVAPMDALPLFGHGDYPAALNQVAYLQLYDRSDSVIPAGGGNSTGWIYVSLDHVQEDWAKIHECATETSSVATEFDGGTTQNAFMEYKSCKTGRRVMRCLYDGVHASSPRSISGKDITADMVMWFFLQFSRGATVHASASGGLSLTNHTNISIDSVAQPVVPEYGHLRR
jgi:poly(3-hydroxybutyrate) depolymerase